MRDGTRHILSGRCIVDDSPSVQLAWAELALSLEVMKPGNKISSSQCTEEHRTRFLLNPSCISLGEDMITPEDLQSSGIDNTIRRLYSEKHKMRYKLLRKYGVVNKKKQTV